MVEVENGTSVVDAEGSPSKSTTGVFFSSSEKLGGVKVGRRKGERNEGEGWWEKGKESGGMVGN